MKLAKILTLLVCLLLATGANATELLASGTTLADSADITAPFSLFIKPASGDTPPPSGVDFWLQKKNAAGNYNTVAVINTGNVANFRTWATGGTYRVERQASGSSAGMDYEKPSAQAVVGSTTFNRAESISAQGYVAGGATYVYATNGYTAYATPTDLICVSEQTAGKHLVVDQFFLSVGATAATVETLYWIKRSTLDTGGTSTTPAMVSTDSTQAATSAVINLYTVAPTTGTSAGTLAVNTVSATAVATAAPATESLQQVSLASNLSTYKAPYVLHNGESICANYNGAAWPSGGTASIHLQVVEVPTP